MTIHTKYQVKLVFLGLTGSWIRIAQGEFLQDRELWIWYPRTHWPGHQVWPWNWYLWHGLLCCTWQTRVQREPQTQKEGPCWIQPPSHQGWIHEMVPAEGNFWLMYCKNYNELFTSKRFQPKLTDIVCNMWPSLLTSHRTFLTGRESSLFSSKNQLCNIKHLLATYLSCLCQNKSVAWVVLK